MAFLLISWKATFLICEILRILTFVLKTDYRFFKDEIRPKKIKKRFITCKPPAAQGSHDLALEAGASGLQYEERKEPLGRGPGCWEDTAGGQAGQLKTLTEWWGKALGAGSGTSPAVDYTMLLPP